MKQLVEFLGLHTEKSLFLVDHALAEKLHCDTYHSSTCALAVTGLEHPELAILDSELHILHILVVAFELVGDCDKLGSTYRH